MISYDSYCMAAQRITVTIQDDLHRKLRFVQADLLRKSNASVSMSGVFDLVLRKGLKWLPVRTPVSITTKEIGREYTKTMVVFVETVTITLWMIFQNVLAVTV